MLSYLSINQKRLLYACSLVKDNLIWNKISVRHLSGDLDLDQLETAVLKLIDRHRLLNANIKIDENKEPFFRLIEGTEKLVKIYDISGEPEEKREASAKMIMENELQTSIDLQNDRLFSVFVIKIGDRDHFLFFKIHHLIGDFSGISLIWRDFALLYNNMACEPIKAEYSDYVDIYNKSMNKDWEVNRNYWLSLFGDPIEFVYFLREISDPSSVNNVARLTLPVTLIKKIEKIALKHRHIPYAYYYSLFLLLLYKYTSQDDIVMGTLFNGRHYDKELRKMAGFYVNTMAIRHSIPGKSSFDEFLAIVQHNIREAYNHQDFPLNELVKEIEYDRKSKHGLPYNVLFNMTDFRQAGIGFSGIEREQVVEVELEHTEVDVSFNVRFYNDKLELMIMYNNEIFSHKTVNRMLEHYVNLLDQVMNCGEQPLDRYSLITADENVELMNMCSGGTLDIDDVKFAPQMLEEYRDDQRTAIVSEFAGGCEKITYAEFNRRCDLIKGFLLRLNRKTGDAVGICLPRSIDLMAGIFGVLKAGCIYVPVDIDHPVDRNKRIIEDANIKQIISAGDYVEQLAVMDVPVEPVENIYKRNDTEFVREKVALASGDCAYILFTSGSTGVPKGVPITHGSLVKCLHSYEKVFGTLARRTGLFTTPITFDVSVLEIFSMLCFGGELHILTNETMINVPKLVDYHLTNEITFSYIYPGIIEAFIHELDKRKAALELKRVKIGVEPVSYRTLRKFMDYVPKAIVVNGYGTTETTISSTYYICRNLPDSDERVPIGRSMPGTRVYVIDRGFNLVPYGIPGEILIGGEGVSSGYINNPEGNENRFLKDPLGANDKGRVFLTGDIAKYLPDGNIEYIGRRDNQIKYSGFRIESAEIEHAVRSYEHIKDAKVLLERNEYGKKILNLYFTADEARISIEELKQFLSKRIPSYMHPVNYFRVNSIPYKASGKLDVEAMHRQSDQLHDDHDRNEHIEKSDETVLGGLLSIIRKILGIEKVDSDENFFKNGGTSFMVIQLMLEIEDHYGVEVEIADFLDLPSIRSLSNVISEKMKSKEN